MGNVLFIISMTVVGFISSMLSIKFQISNKIWNALKIEKDYIKVIIFLILVVVLSLAASFIFEKLYISYLMQRAIKGAMIGLCLALIPYSVKEGVK